MLEVQRIIDSIANTSSRNEKEDILSQYKDNVLLREVLFFIYNPYIVTGLSDKKMKKKVAIRGFNVIDNLMEYLKVNNTGSDLDIASVQHYIRSQPEELQELYTQMATKNLKVGITSKTINKIFGEGFIPSFDVMLANKYEDHEHKINEFIITEKLDGCRAVIIKENGHISVFSRQGQQIEGLIDIENEVKLFPDNMVYDGELLLLNSTKLNSADLYRSTVKEVRKDGIKKNVEFYAFDMLPLNEFQKGISVKGCLERKRELSDLLKEIRPQWIKLVPMLYVGNDKNVIYKMLDMVEKDDKEGIMVNAADGKYECKRSSGLLKVKTMQSADLLIVGFEEGTNKYEGKLGRINVEYKGNIVGVGSGFTDEDRVEIWNNQDKYLGRVCEVQFFEETKNQNDDKLSLRFPVFKGIREIGKEVSYY